MTTRPHHEPASIAADARNVLNAARAAEKNAEFKKRVTAHELDAFETKIKQLESGDGARSTTLHGQVAAGVHVATSRAAIATAIADARDDAKLAFPSDRALQHAFGVGALVSAASTGSVRHEAEALLSAAAAHPAEAKKIGLDAHGVHALETMVHALDGTALAHVEATNNRHLNTTATDSLAHAVSAEAAHVRLAARRVFRGDDAALTPFNSSLPRHAVVPRTATNPPSAPAGGAPTE